MAAAGLGKLRQAGKNLRAQWAEAHSAWHDENSRLFEEQYVTPLLAGLRRLELTLAQMGTVLQEIRRDCG